MVVRDGGVVRDVWCGGEGWVMISYSCTAWEQVHTEAFTLTWKSS